jgi:hypothetical protein
VSPCCNHVAATLYPWAWKTTLAIPSRNNRGNGATDPRLATATVYLHSKPWTGLALNAGWDDALLKIELGDLQAFDFDLGLIGFSADEIAGLTFDRSGLTDPDEAPEAPAVPVSKPGDVWLLGRHRLVCGDCTDPLVVDKALAGVKPHLMVSDPPYGVGFERGKFVGREKAAKGQRFAPIANDDLRGAALAEFIGSARCSRKTPAGNPARACCD